jgi:radical SAM superfamily enzyme YgiQ (UPF0313 family)
LKIVFVDLSSESYSAYPFGLYALKAFLAANGCEAQVEIVIFKSSGDVSAMADSLAQVKPDVLGVTCFVWNEESVHELCRLTRSRGISEFVLLGGPQVESFDPAVAKLIEEGAVSAAVVGEGEYPLLALVTGIQEAGRVPGGVAGVASLETGGLVWNPVAALEKGIDYLPSPATALADMKSTVMSSGIAMYESSRGCPYQCTFCDQGTKTFRSHSLERIASDLADIVALRPDKLIFLDSTFNVSPARTREILQSLIRLRSESGHAFEIEAEVKPERCDEEMVLLMREAGFKSIEVGLQSTKQSTLQFIKRGNNFPKIMQAVSLLLASEIEVHVDTIIGLPGESLEDWLDTVDYCFSLGDVNIFSNVLKVLPNSALKVDIIEHRLGFEIDKSDNYVVKRSDAMTGDDLELARLHQKMLKLVWNRSDDKAALRDVVNSRFSGRITNFTAEALLLLSQGAFEDSITQSGFWRDHEPRLRRPNAIRPSTKAAHFIPINAVIEIAGTQ